ncbi:hypothetical protein S40288_07723, partial [Stachybotrys chartarum IBT 40288]
MASLPVIRENVDDLWAEAIAQLSDEDKCNIDFSCPDKLNAVADLSGETVILRDVFEKLVKWIDIFKEIGDIAVQYDPFHAALPWAGIRFLLQTAVNDHAKFGEVLEGVSWVAELICRYAVVERLYSSQGELRRVLIKLYIAILIYLSKAKLYLEKGSAKRIFESALPTQSKLDQFLEDIRTAHGYVGECTSLVDRDDQLRHYAELKRLLADIDTPVRRMNDGLSMIQDDLQASKRIKVLGWLSSQPYIQHHEQTKVGLIPGTGQWLLTDPVFQKWKKESASSIIWLHGIPGFGKSKLVSIVIEDAINSFRVGQSSQPAFFYSSRNPAEPARSDPREIFASLARQLSSLEPGTPILKPTVDLYNKKELEGSVTGPLRIEDSCDLIIQLGEYYPQLIIVIDALDESDQMKRPDLLKALERILRESSSLIKVFVSSRDDQDLVLRLQRYLNLEIKSDKNSSDIAVFTKKETERLIEDGLLLKYSSAGPACSCNIFARLTWTTISKTTSLNPSDLNTLYGEMHEVLSNKPGEVQRAVFRSVLSWLLCAERFLTSAEFLAAISSVLPEHGGARIVKKDLVLKTCNNFVVFDAQLDTFRFAHLSVREFLEKSENYRRTDINALAAQACLRNLVRTDLTLTTIPNNEMSSAKMTATYTFGEYATVYWALHSKLAGDRRTSGPLKDAIWLFIFGNDGTSRPLQLWSKRVAHLLSSTTIDTKVRLRLKDSIMLSAPFSAPVTAHFISAAFDFPELLKANRVFPKEHSVSEQDRSALHVSAIHGSCESMKIILDRIPDVTHITGRAITAAAGNESSGKEMAALLLGQCGDKVEITEEVVESAAGNWSSGKEVMALLLDQRGDKFRITEKMIEAAACSHIVGKEVMKLLLSHPNSAITISAGLVQKIARSFDALTMRTLLLYSGDKVKITEEVIEAVARNRSSSKEVMALLLDQRGDEIKITVEVIEAAAGNWSSGKELMALLLDHRSDEVKITEKVVEATIKADDIEMDYLQLLLKRREVDVPMDNLQLLLERRGVDVPISVLPGFEQLTPTL